MTAGVLLAWAGLLAVAAPPMLRRAAWTERAPRLGVLTWQAASVSMLGALVLSGVMLAVPASGLSSGYLGLLTNCVMAARALLSSSAGATAACAGILAASAIAVWMSCVSCWHAHQAVRQRRAHGQALSLLGRPARHLGAVVLDHPIPTAYCLPGRDRRIVVSTGALEALDETQLAAVLAHERAHLTWRHHHAIAAATALGAAFPFVPLLRDAATAIPRLIEMAADDTAAHHTDRGTVASALIALAAAPRGALGAGGPAALTRIRRLLRPAAPLPRAVALAALTTALALITAPPALALTATSLADALPVCTAHR
ncbi:MAG: M56 family metallopeptidase [Streptomycetales bacterium]